MLRRLLSRQQRGEQGESRARHHLERAGLHFRAANVRFRFGELDLIMDEGDTLVFVEVRVRSHAAGSADHRKQRRLSSPASAYLAANPTLAQRNCRFDIVATNGPAETQLEWLRNAFTADDLGPRQWR